MIPALSKHALHTSAPRVAAELSSLLQNSVCHTVKSTYATAMRSLTLFCDLHPGLVALPADAQTIAGWLHWMCPTRIKPPSCAKYLAGIRWAHICAGFPWTLSCNPLVKQTLHALKRRYPELCIAALKVPMTYDLMLRLASSLNGWPRLEQMSYDDLLWLCACSIAFFGCLRGGEFFSYPSSNRHVLLSSMVSLLRPQSSKPAIGVAIRVPFPKTKPYSAFEMAYAISPSSESPLCPVMLLLAYRSRRSSLGISPSGDSPCFSLVDGKAMDRSFMIGRTELLMRRCHISVHDDFNNLVPLKAASWRSGYATSALHAGISELQIKSSGRWSSSGGVLPYSVNSTIALQRVASTIVSAPSVVPVSVFGRNSWEPLH